MTQQVIIDYLCNLININTTIDSNNEIEGILYIKKVFDEIGIKSDVYEPVSGKGNILAIIKGKSKDAILLHSHIDTANYEAENWLFPPNKSTIINNCIVGRGALDCKGLTAIWMAIMKDLFSSGKKLKNTIIFMCSCDEETTGKYGTEWLLGNTNILDNVKLVLGEGGGYPIRLEHDYYFTIQTGEITEELGKSSNYTEYKVKRIFNRAIDLGYYNQNTLNFYNNSHFQTKRRIPKQYFYENIETFLYNNKKVNYQDYFNIIETELKRINHNYKLLPVITPGYSDNRFFRQKEVSTLGFFPLHIKNNISGIHGNNEYISFKSLELSYMILSKIIHLMQI